MISYEPFWETLKIKNISQYTLIEKYNISSSVLTRIRKNDYLSLRKIEDLSIILNCEIQDIVQFVDNPENAKKKKKTQQRMK